LLCREDCHMMIIPATCSSTTY